MRSNNIIGKIDIWLLLIYLALITIGLFSIYAAAFNEDHPAIYDLSQNYGKQLIFIAANLLVGCIILLIDAKFFNTLAFGIYALSILLLVLVLLVGTKISGSTSWIHIGPMSFQPSEFAKFGTALALAHYLGKIDTDTRKRKTRLIAYGIIVLPMLFILAQGDAGSALVFLAFLLVLYREGMGGKLLITGSVAIVLFISTLIFKRLYVILGVTVIYGLIIWLIDKKKRKIVIVTAIFLASIAFIFSVDFAFHNILKQHQQNRILIILGLEEDPQGVGYNLNQSKIAIGSGGFLGKGFMQGTMTRYNYVPEQHTDFIFCTIGEETGFAGCLFLISLYLALMLRIITLAERQRSPFSRIYGYGIACIFFFHFAINIGMTIGLVPVIGIPLPFLSYGGSSFSIFSIMIFVFLKQDANRMNIL